MHSPKSALRLCNLPCSILFTVCCQTSSRSSPICCQKATRHHLHQHVSRQTIGTAKHGSMLLWLYSLRYSWVSRNWVGLPNVHRQTRLPTSGWYTQSLQLLANPPLCTVISLKKVPGLACNYSVSCFCCPRRTP
ncbi:hypothetical protein BDP55DRAFT_682897 [Colletotrichum godetiae]|uniref:Secreted protein n=1 Tax=Colletotrichum godetiae TaxID=1209918 RepID=A0AAJ0AB91_9PEZI|nr:uncharacterized protein BDP55DRAFT_682897 [Colletotrichum godetiae]KAK1658406.1 hypothetical protein BDP55DRAFT_682897 [Colletotrichum godetiae]